MPQPSDASNRPRFSGNLDLAVERFFTPRKSPPTRRDDALLNKGVRLSANCALAGTTWGDGPTVLLAHGWESRGTHWGILIGTLAEAGFRAVAVDAPAHGDSPGTTANMLQYARALVQVGLELGPLAGIVGHSFGAGAAAIALRRGLAVERAVVISSPSSIVALVERWGRHHGMNEAELPQFLELVARQVGCSMEELDLSTVARNLKQPALVIHDRDDQDIPMCEGQAVAEAWPGAKLLLTERYGHRRILLARPVQQEVLSFLGR